MLLDNLSMNSLGLINSFVQLFAIVMILFISYYVAYYTVLV